MRGRGVQVWTLTRPNEGGAWGHYSLLPHYLPSLVRYDGYGRFCGFPAGTPLHSARPLLPFLTSYPAVALAALAGLLWHANCQYHDQCGMLGVGTKMTGTGK